MHVASDRLRLEKLLEQSEGSEGPNDQVEQVLASFNACVDILVDIGERCLLRLPTNNHSRQLGAMIVRGLLEAYVDGEKLAPHSGKPMSYFAGHVMHDRVVSVISDFRYADALTESCNNPLLDPSRSVDHELLGCTPIERLIGFQPPKDVQDVVRGLFVRDLVELQMR